MAPSATTRPSPRRSAEERREEIVEVAVSAFAARGLYGTPTQEIASEVGISHAYLFRLFPTKLELFLAAVERGFDRTLETFEDAVERVGDGDALEAMGRAYGQMLKDRRLLQVQLHAYAASDDPQVREVVRRRFSELYRWVEKVPGADQERVRSFFSTGMLMNVAAALDLENLDAGWVQRCLPPAD